MPNKKTVALTREQVAKIIKTMKQGFMDENGKVFKPNERIAFALALQANVGLRIGDLLKLRLIDFVRDGYRYRLDLVEEKTGKERTFSVAVDVQTIVWDYACRNNIGARQRLFDVSERAVQKQLKIVCDYLGYERVGTHSFRKFFATEIYNNNNCDIALVSLLLQHSNTAITRRYIGIQQKDVENALENHFVKF
jgi:integrase